MSTWTNRSNGSPNNSSSTECLDCRAVTKRKAHQSWSATNEYLTHVLEQTRTTGNSARDMKIDVIAPVPVITLLGRELTFGDSAIAERTALRFPNLPPLAPVQTLHHAQQLPEH